MKETSKNLTVQSNQREAESRGEPTQEIYLHKKKGRPLPDYAFCTLHYILMARPNAHPPGLGNGSKNFWVGALIPTRHGMAQQLSTLWGRQQQFLLYLLNCD